MSAIASMGPVEQETLRVWIRRVALFATILMSGGNLLIPRLPLLAAIVMLFLLYRSPLVLLRRELGGIALVLIAVLIVALLGGGAFSVGPMVNRYANFFAGILVLGMYLLEPRQTLIDDLVPMTTLFAIQAIATPFAVIAFSEYFQQLEYEDITYHTLLGIFTYHDLLINASGIKRPDGFFYEPGVLQIYLNILLYICLFVRYDYKRAGVAVLAILATQSTMGYFVTVFLMVCAYLRRLIAASPGLKVVIAFAVPILMAPLLVIAYNDYVNKTEGELRGSAWARQYDLYTGLSIVAEYPLTGIGFDLERYFQVSQRLGYRGTQLDANALTERVSSNGLVSLAFTLGLPMFFVFMFGLFRQRFFPHRLVVGVMFCLGLLTEAILLTPFFTLLIFSGFLRSAPPALRRSRAAGPRAAAGRVAMEPVRR